MKGKKKGGHDTPFHLIENMNDSVIQVFLVQS